MQIVEAEAGSRSLLFPLIIMSHTTPRFKDQMFFFLVNRRKLLFTSSITHRTDNKSRWINLLHRETLVQQIFFFLIF